MFKTAKYFLGILTLCGAVASCVKVNTEEPEREPVPVTFSTYGQRAVGTKADASFVAPGADFATGAVIGVYGFYHEDCTWAADSTAGANIPDFMYHTAVTKQSDGSWTYSPVKYWPNEFGAGATSDDVDRLSFWGYYPRNAAGLNLYKPGTTTAYDNNTSGLPKAHFVVNSNIANQVDLMFTEPLRDLYKTQEHTVGTETHRYGTATNGEVTLVFRHALSLVQFNIRSSGASLPAGAEIVIKSLTLTNIKTTGTCEKPYASFATEAQAQTYWTTSATPTVTMTVPTGTAGAAGSMLVLMPQTLEEEGSTHHSVVKLDMVYDIRFPAAHDPTTFISYADNTAEKYLWSDTGTVYGVKRWLPGRKYVYNIDAGLEKIEFSEVTEASWTTEWTE
ncbi:MAG: fimbrillin family protein [Bacteroidales bacterium]|nr:fimbrillin family protein [Bacteroidales bacterium]